MNVIHIGRIKSFTVEGLRARTDIFFLEDGNKKVVFLQQLCFTKMYEFNNNTPYDTHPFYIPVIIRRDTNNYRLVERRFSFVADTLDYVNYIVQGYINASEDKKSFIKITDNSNKKMNYD